MIYNDLLGMRLWRRSLCSGRSTALVVVILMSTFIIFDFYTHQLFSNWSNSLSFDFLIGANKDVSLISSSEQISLESKSILQTGEKIVVTNHEIQSQLEVHEEAHELQDQLEAEIATSERGLDVIPQMKEKPNNKDHLPRLPADCGYLPEQQEGGRNGSDLTDLKHEGEGYLSPITAANTSIPELTNVQRVELDLLRARAAFRRVALSLMNNGDRVEEICDSKVNQPQGQAYKNACLFQRSYQEMENRFKIYIYEEGEEPLVHDGPCKEIYAIEGRFIQELHDNNPYVTSNPEEAHVYFLPFSVANMVTYLYKRDSGDMSPLLRFVQDYTQVVAKKYPHWNRSEGADHFMLSCHDWGPHVSRVDKNLFSKTIRVLCNANTSEGFVPFKDVSLPEVHLVGGEVPTDLGGLPVSKRTFLAFFAGAEHGPVRPQLFKYWERKDSDIVVRHRLPARGITYHEYMKNSKFCICPGGYEVNSPRLVEAIYNDCIPVIIADRFVLPFSDVLDWTAFSLQVLEEDIPKLKELLEAVPMETLVRMQDRVKEIRKHFLLNQPPERYDLFHMILHSVWMRRLNIRILE
ncbi:xylogalacturonan beta-1,3-xylosyltransferase [Marchantia polymorpha subsp. ruderalis]